MTKWVTNVREMGPSWNPKYETPPDLSVAQLVLENQTQIVDDVHQHSSHQSQLELHGFTSAENLAPSFNY